jgi:hypothetical protein
MLNINYEFEKLGIKNPYNRFLNDSTIKENLVGWNGIGSTMQNRIKEKKPSVIVEVGSFLGHSTVMLGKNRKTVDNDFVIYCVDTWLGSYEHWRKDFCDMLNLFGFYENGISGLYDQFVKNIILNDLHNNVVPIPCTSNVGCELLKFNNVKADFIYIDASHEAEDVYNDIKRYYPLLKDGGIMFGDDYPWDSVKAGVNRYCLEFNKKVESEDCVFWRIV